MNSDLFIYDTERFNSIASDDILQQGLTFFTEHKVVALDRQDHALIAQVEDSDVNKSYKIELTQSTGGKLVVQCECADQNSVCKHAVAVLHSYKAYTDRYKQDIDNATQETIQGCIHKGKHDIRVKLISGNLGFGVWQATSTIPTAHGPQAYQVHIRSLNKRVNYCTCPDLNRNRLGTCQHIEAVLHYAQSKPGFSAFKEAGSPVSFVYLAWENNKPVIRLYPIATMSDDLTAICADFFCSQQDFYRPFAR